MIIGVIIALIFLYILYMVMRIRYTGSHNTFKIEDFSLDGIYEPGSTCVSPTFTLTKNLTTDFTNWKDKRFVASTKTFGNFSGDIDSIVLKDDKVVLTSKCLDQIPNIMFNAEYQHDDGDSVIVMF